MEPLNFFQKLSDNFISVYNKQNPTIIIVWTHKPPSVSGRKGLDGIKRIGMTRWKRWSTRKCAREWNVTRLTNGIYTSKNLSKKIRHKIRLYVKIETDKWILVKRLNLLLINKKNNLSSSRFCRSSGDLIRCFLPRYQLSLFEGANFSSCWHPNKTQTQGLQRQCFIS